MLGGLVVLVAASVALSLQAEREAVERAEADRLEHQANVVEKNLAPRLQATWSVLDKLRLELPTLRDRADGTRVLVDRMSMLAEATSGIRTFLLVDAQGRVVASNRPALMGVDVSAGERYQSIRARPDAATLYLSAPFVTPLGNWAMSLGAAVLDREGRFDGYLLAIVDPDYWGLLLDSTRYAPDMSVSVIHSGGKIVHRVPERGGAAGLDLKAHPQAPFHEHVRTGATDTFGVTRLATTGAESFVKLRTIRPGATQSDGFVVASFARPTDAVFAPWREGARRRVAFLVGGSLVTAAGLLVLQRRRRGAEQWEEAGRASAATLKVITDTIPDPVFMKDRECRITFANPATLGVFGRPAGEVLGRTDEELYPDPAIGRALMEVDRRIMDSGRPETVEETVLRADGRRVYLSTKAPVRDRDGRVTGIVGVATDITERRESEAARVRLGEQLAQAQKMEVVGRLAGGVAHDFNNLLTIILTCGLQLQEDLRDGRPVDPEQAADVVAAAHRAADLTRQLLAFARREMVVPEEMDLNEVVRQSRKLLGRVIGEDVRLDVELQEGLWNVRCDRGLLGQVVMNLAVNARDAMPQGGTLHIATANRSLPPGDSRLEAEMAPGDWVEISVRDDGVGMSPEVLQHIFEPFYTTKPVGAGTGLGLAMVFGIVKQAGGAIGVRSEPGKGTEFRVFLPAVHPGSEETARRPVEDRGGTESILLVEDEPKVREVTTHVLRSAGYRVQVASSGEEAIAWLLAGGGPVDLVITDVVMPGMGGSELASQVDVLRRGTRFLYVSGFTQDAILRQGIADDGLEFLAKPFTPDALRARVRAVLDRA